MQKSNLFQTILIVVFGLAILVAVLIFAGIIPTPGEKTANGGAQGTVVLWGTYDQSIMTSLLEQLNRTNKTYKIIYMQKQADTLQGDLVNAIASGQGPDLVILSNNDIIRNSNKVYHIPFASYSERAFRDTFVPAGDLFLMSDGIMGLPLTVDPMLLYYNTNMFEEAGIAKPPATWEDVIKDIPLLTKRSPAGLTQAAIGMGTYANVTHAKDIIAMLLLQSGNVLVSFEGATPTASLSGSESVLTFYTGFADPLKDTYTWNRAQSNSKDAFVNETLAMYFGYASELPGIVAKNPNLHFDIARVPTIATSTAKATIGRINAVAVVKSSQNFNTALYAASQLSGADFSGRLTSQLFTVAPIAPARRDLLSQTPQGIYGPMIFNSALSARGWRDPDSVATGKIFSMLIDDIVRGALSPVEAVRQANDKLKLTLLAQ